MGHPFFIQEFASQTWTTIIGLGDVERAAPLAVYELDSGFFRVRFEGTTDAERTHLRAMASLGPGPHASAAVAAVLETNTNQLGPVRDRLIRGGLCYAPRWGEIAFTVPKFDEFLRRAAS